MQSSIWEILIYETSCCFRFVRSRQRNLICWIQLLTTSRTVEKYNRVLIGWMASRATLSMITNLARTRWFSEINHEEERRGEHRTYTITIADKTSLPLHAQTHCMIFGILFSSPLQSVRTFTSVSLIMVYAFGKHSYNSRTQLFNSYCKVYTDSLIQRALRFLLPIIFVRGIFHRKNVLAMNARNDDQRNRQPMTTNTKKYLVWPFINCGDKATATGSHFTLTQNNPWFCQ